MARVLGIPVNIDYRWFFVFALSTWLVAETFQQEYGVARVRLDGSVAWVAGLLTTFGLFLSVFGHELAHALMGRAEGIEIEEIVLHPFGGLARLKREPDSPRAEFRIAAAGPAASFLFALASYAGMYLTRWGASAAWAILLLVSAGNLMLALFNLLPGYPLDGGRVLRAFLWHRTKELPQATRTVSLFGQMIALVVMLFGVFMAFRYQAYFMAVWSVLVGLFLWDAARAVLRAQEAAAAGGATAARTVSEIMVAPFAVEPDTLVSYFVDSVLPLHRQEVMPVARRRRLHGLLALADLKKLPRERWHTTRVSEVMRPVAPQFFVGPSATLAHADELMQRNGAGALAVVDAAGELVGFLRRKQLKRVAPAE